MRVLSNIDTIVMHNSDSYDSKSISNYEDIYNWHVRENGWLDVGYDEVIEQVDGKWVSVKTSRLSKGLNAAAVRGHNDHTYNICIVGDFDKYAPSAECYEFASRVVKKAMRKLPKVNAADSVKPHNFYNPTSCPGKYFDMSYLRTLVKSGDEVETWKLEGLNALSDIIEEDKWIDKLDEPMPTWAVLNLLNRIRKGK